jgi:deoxyribodipyrimidine photo-lyase
VVTRSVLWFRRDLRLDDHPALIAAAAEGDVVPLFVVDPAFAGAGAPRRAFLAGCLAELRRDTNSALVIREGDPATVVPAVAAAAGADTVHATEDFGPYGRRRDAAVAEALAAVGRRLTLTGSPYAVAPAAVVKDNGQPYAVFTPFARAWRAAGWDDPAPAPDVRWACGVDSEPLPEAPAVGAQLPPAGERAAQERLEEFLAKDLGSYDADRDRPDLDATSHLSPYLRWGCLHPRQALVHLGRSRAHDRFRTELAWREFYADVLFRQPRSAWWNHDERMDAMEIDAGPAAEDRFAAWAGGQTGFPIVDAGMRQLLATGWMHNRVRMVTASFLVKDLHLPWQWGARHFLAHLVDGDLASNSHGWQWVAGTGTDAAPYFRIFNPLTQSQRFDPRGDYIRRWLPELADIATADVHAPSAGGRGAPLGYPAPMVDHAEEREEALRRYAQVTGRGGTPARTSSR